MLYNGDAAATDEPRDAQDPQYWRLRARCRFMGVEIFYAPDLETAGARTRRERVARETCALCSVRSRCYEYALENKELHGVWGGLTESERRRMRYGRDVHPDLGTSSKLA